MNGTGDAHTKVHYAEPATAKSTVQLVFALHNERLHGRKGGNRFPEIVMRTL